MTNAIPTDSEPTSQASLYYRHSGKAPPVAVIVALIGGLAAAIAAAMIYALGDVYVPLFYLKFVLGIGLGAVLGGVAPRLMRAGKVRNNFLATLVVTAVAIVGYYAVWVCWIWVLLRKAGLNARLIRIFEQPTHVWRLARTFNQFGTWSFQHAEEPVTGVFLWIIWAAEAVFIFFFTWTAAKKIVTAEPFCEVCGIWCGKPKRLGTIPMRDVIELRRQLESADFTALGPLSPQRPAANQWLTFLHHSCPKCGDLNTLSAQKVTMTENRKSKKSQLVVKTVVDKLLLHPGEAELLVPPPAPPTEPLPA